MLNHEQPQEQIQSPAAQVRVTPEELAAALARLEARRAGADGKIAIGDAVSELSLDATPEEVLAEVQAGQKQVQAVAQTQTTQTQRQSPQRQHLAAYVAVGALVFIMAGLFGVRTAAPRVDVTAISPAVNLTPQRLSLNPNLLVGDRAGKMILLSEVGDNQPVHCDYWGGFQPYSPGNGMHWTLIKHDGKPYVRGWILKMSPAVLAQDGADVSNYGDPAYAIRITLPMRGFDVGTPNGDDARFHAQNIHLDGHAYEKW